MAVTSFIPELWNARLLENLRKSHVATNLVNTDYEGMITGQGDTVHINSIGDITVKNYTKNSDMSNPDDLSTVDQSLVISEAKYFNFQVDDIDKVQASGELVDVAMGNASYQLSDVADQFILGTMLSGANSANKMAETALTANNIYQYLVDLRLKLDKQNVPTAQRSVVIPPEAYALLLQDARFVAGGGSQAEATVRNGLVGAVAGFTVYESNNCPVTDGYKLTTDSAVVAGKTYYTESAGVYTKITSPQTSDIASYYERYDILNIIASVPTATTYAEQIVKTEAYRMEKRFADGVKGLHVYGAKVTNGKAIAVLPATF